MALAAKLDRKDYKIYCVISDGECQEGQTWEAAQAAVHYKLDNLCAMLDRNGTQIDGRTEEIMKIEPIAEKWRAFGWDTVEIDGHDYGQIILAFEKFLQNQGTGRPTMIVARTVIGKGVSFMEGDYHWHHGAPTLEQLEQALRELS
jgi:transketolase